MAQKEITIEDLDILFNGDKRGRQFFIINTDGLRNFNINGLSSDSEYAVIREALKTSTNYLDVQNSFFTNINTLKNSANTSPNKVAFEQKYNENFVEVGPGKPILTDSSFLKVSDIVEFVNSVHAHILSIGSIGKSYPDEIIDGSGKPSNIDDLDKYIALQLKNAWKKYKMKDTIDYVNKLKYGEDVSAFIESNDDKIIIINDKYHKLKKSGKIEEITNNDKHNCKSYGFGSENDCNAILYECLVNPSTDKLSKCIINIDESIKKYTTTDDNLKNMHPEIVLALLHRFGFKAVKNTDGKKYIISAQSWKNKILDNLDIDKSKVSISVIEYLQKLVDYVNSKPELLNGNKFTTNDFYDPVSKKDKFGRPVDETTTNKKALEGLTRFYDSRQNNRGLRNNFGDYMKDLYDLYFPNRSPPSYLQLGGASNSPYDLLKAEMSSGNIGVKYLTRIYESLKSLLTNVDIIEVDVEIKKYLKELETNETNIIKYLDFVDKVNNIYHLFKYAPSKSISFTGTDIDALNTQLDNKINEYREKEDLVAKFIQALARRNENPLSNSDSVFDI